MTSEVGNAGAGAGELAGRILVAWTRGEEGGGALELGIVGFAITVGGWRGIWRMGFAFWSEGGIRDRDGGGFGGGDFWGNGGWGMGIQRYRDRWLCGVMGWFGLGWWWRCFVWEVLYFVLRKSLSLIDFV